MKIAEVIIPILFVVTVYATIDALAFPDVRECMASGTQLATFMISFALFCGYTFFEIITSR